MIYVKFAKWTGRLAFFILPALMLAQGTDFLPGLNQPNPVHPTKPDEPAKKREGFKMPIPQPEPALPPQPSQQSLMEETIQKQLESFRSFDPSKAYYAFTSKSFQKEVPLDAFKNFVKRFSVLFRNKAFNFEGLSFQGIVATVKGKLTSVDGQIYNVEYDLIQEDGAWKIRKINLVKTQNSQKKG